MQGLIPEGRISSLTTLRLIVAALAVESVVIFDYNEKATYIVVRRRHCM